MISWRTSRIFLLCLASLAVFIVMLFGASDIRLSSLTQFFQEEPVTLPQPVAHKVAPRPDVNPVLVIPKDAPSIFEEV